MKTLPVIPVLALCVGLLLIMQGLLGIAVPGVFVSVVRFFQTPSMIYVAAAVRIAIGIVLLYAVTGSRFPIFLRVFGALIVIGARLRRFTVPSLRTPFLLCGSRKVLAWCGSLRLFL